MWELNTKSVYLNGYSDIKKSSKGHQKEKTIRMADFKGKLMFWCPTDIQNSL